LADRPQAITLGADKAYDTEDFVNELQASNPLKRRRAQPQAIRLKVTEIPKARTTYASCPIIASPRSTEKIDRH
jgi:hypothetical protein